MLDQALPLRASAVESHAAAVTAAEDALDAAIELQASGQGHLADVVAALDGQVRQQRAFLAAVSRYNHDIADYALEVVPPQTTPAVLVGTLIKQNRPAGQPVVPLPTTAALGSIGILPASSSVGFQPASGSIPTWPTRAAPPGGTADQSPEVIMPAGAEETAPANSPGGVGIVPASPAVVAPPNPQQSSEPEEPRLAPPQETVIPLLEQGAGEAPGIPVRGSRVEEQGVGSKKQEAKSREQNDRPTASPSDTRPPAGPTTRSSQKPISGSDPPQGFSPETHEAPAMSTWSQGLTPADRAVKLTAVLYADRNSPSPPGQPVRLIDCLQTVATNNRANVVDVYWAVRQAAAQYETLLQEIEWLEALRTTLAAQNPPSPTAMLKLRAGRLAVEARRADTEADWTMARHQLAALAVGREPAGYPGYPLAGRGSGSNEQGATSREQRAKAISSPRLSGVGFLPQPVSVPFVGRLPLPASSSDRSWPQRRLEATIPLRQQAIIDQAAVVVEADALRAAATADFLIGRVSLERALAGIELEAQETTVFLRGVTEYNRTICRYVTFTLPAGTQVEKFVAALMVDQ
jgi:hypothetical protein